MKFLLMNQNNVVAKICVHSNFKNITIDEVYNIELLPLHVQYDEENPDETFSHWIKHRAIPTTREDLTYLLKKTNCIHPFELCLKNKAISLTDHYWIKEENDSTSWDEINYFDNNYSEEIGNLIVGLNKNKINNLNSPDITTNGWLKKAWRRHEDGNDYLYKLGSYPYYQEPLNEVFCSELMKKFCDLDFVQYDLGKIDGQYCSICKNFVSKNLEFVPAFSVYRTAKRPFYIEPYDFLVDRCNQFNITGVKEFIDAMIAFDYLISNTDRHMGNFGFMRDINTLEFKGMAPLFDNGTSLLSTENINQIGLKEEYCDPVQKIKLIKNFDAMNINNVKDMSELLHEILKSGNANPKRIDAICKKYNERWKELYRLMEHSISKKLYKKDIERDESEFEI